MTETTNESKKKWYVLHVYSGQEKNVVELINERCGVGTERDIEQILVPTKEVTEIKNGERQKRKKNVFPGYIMLKMHLNDKIIHILNSLPKVNHLLGSDQQGPVAISEDEAQNFLSHVDSSGVIDIQEKSFQVGEEVRVGDGPFIDFNGFVEEVDSEKSRLKVSVMIFGRPTPLDLNFDQVEKL